LSNNAAVIGLGNSLRRDDGIGVVVLESLFNDYKQSDIDYLNFGIASFDLIHRLENYNTVLLIDGIDAGLAAGELKIFSLDEASFLQKDGAVSSHELNLKDIFRLTGGLGIKAKIYVAGIQVQDTGFGESLTQPLKDKLPQLAKQINEFIVIGTFLDPK